MASSVTSAEKLFSQALITMYDHDPGGTSATVVTPDGGTTLRYVDLLEYGGFAVAAMSSTLTGNGISLLEIVAADDTAGTNAIQVKTSGAVTADAVGDMVVLECTADEVAQLSAENSYTSRYVAGRITVANAADEAVVTYIRFDPTHERRALTANVIA